MGTHSPHPIRKPAALAATWRTLVGVILGTTLIPAAPAGPAEQSPTDPAPQNAPSTAAAATQPTSRRAADSLPADAGLVGFRTHWKQRQLLIEQRIVELADAAEIRKVARTLGERPHIAGTTQQARTRDFVIETMTGWGLQPSLAEYEVYLPFPATPVLERVEPDPRRFDVREPPLRDDDYSLRPVPLGTVHGYSGTGDVTGELVYVNYARPEDLDRLEQLGVRLEGRIAIARYGRLYRGYKVLNVQQRGAVACLLFSDPMDDGYFRGTPYPAGPMRAESSVQHGSVKVGPPGDPTTPGFPSLPGMGRLAPEDSPFLVRIPSLPIGHAIARELLAGVGGEEVPQEWQGALPLRYHLGPGPVKLRVKVEDDGGTRRIWNTFGRITGSEFPNEWVIAGAHRDAWCCGAADNVSGCASVLEAARICAELAKAGYRPRRTIIFATWDAEEWGIIGSAEWAEQFRGELEARAVAYINQDMVATGPSFGASASPSLAAFVREATRAVPHPDQPEKTIYDVWRGERPAEIELGTPGGGSDHAPFSLYLGIPVTAHGFGGRQGIYHSLYDTPQWMERFGDPGYRRHRANAMLTAVLMLRLANSDALPHDLGHVGRQIVTRLDELETELAESEANGARSAALAAVRAAAQQFATEAEKLVELRRAIDWDKVEQATVGVFNALLRDAELSLTRPDEPEGADGAATGAEAADPAAYFERNLVYGIEPGSGYGLQWLPHLRRAIDRGDEAAAAAEAQVLAGQLHTATQHVARATALLRRSAERSAEAAAEHAGD